VKVLSINPVLICLLSQLLDDVRRDRDDKIYVTHPMIEQGCLTSAIARRSTLTAETSKLNVGFTVQFFYFDKL
jgi:hypothetical protein